MDQLMIDHQRKRLVEINYLIIVRIRELCMNLVDEMKKKKRLDMCVAFVLSGWWDLEENKEVCVCDMISRYMAMTVWVFIGCVERQRRELATQHWSKFIANNTNISFIWFQKIK